MGAYQGVRNAIFLENFGYVLMNDPLDIRSLFRR